jgi:hypothetical protein
MTTDEKLAAFIVATNERLDRMEKTLNEVVASLTITPEMKAEIDDTMEQLRQMAARMDAETKN